MKIKKNITKEIEIEIETPAFFLSRTPVSEEVYAVTEQSSMKLYISDDVATIQKFPLSLLTEILDEMERITEDKFLDYYQKAMKIHGKFIAEFQTAEIPY